MRSGAAGAGCQITGSQRLGALAMQPSTGFICHPDEPLVLDLGQRVRLSGNRRPAPAGDDFRQHGGVPARPRNPSFACQNRRGIGKGKAQGKS